MLTLEGIFGLILGAAFWRTASMQNSINRQTHKIKRVLTNADSRSLGCPCLIVSTPGTNPVSITQLKSFPFQHSNVLYIIYIIGYGFVWLQAS